MTTRKAIIARCWYKVPSPAGLLHVWGKPRTAAEQDILDAVNRIGREPNVTDDWILAQARRFGDLD